MHGHLNLKFVKVIEGFGQIPAYKFSYTQKSLGKFR